MARIRHTRGGWGARVSGQAEDRRRERGKGSRLNTDTTSVYLFSRGSPFDLCKLCARCVAKQRGESLQRIFLVANLAWCNSAILFPLISLCLFPIENDIAISNEESNDLSFPFFFHQTYIRIIFLEIKTSAGKGGEKKNSRQIEIYIYIYLSLSMKTRAILRGWLEDGPVREIIWKWRGMRLTDGRVCAYLEKLDADAGIACRVEWKRASKVGDEGQRMHCRNESWKKGEKGGGGGEKMRREKRRRCERVKMRRPDQRRLEKCSMKFSRGRGGRRRPRVAQFRS